MRPQRRYFVVQLSNLAGVSPLSGSRGLFLAKEDVLWSIREQLARCFGEFEVARSQLRALHDSASSGNALKTSSSSGSSAGQITVVQKNEQLFFFVCARSSFEKVHFAITMLRGVVTGSATSKAALAAEKIGDSSLSLFSHDDKTSSDINASASFVPALPRLRFNAGALQKALAQYKELFNSDILLLAPATENQRGQILEQWNASMKREIDQLIGGTNL
ncbi:unnamed protein product [Amoebophrya sp. A25]|nr:unnamed protein product [Amoebophrya sp. A25]|eukprot:GSA25T00020638001.1